MCTLDLWMLKLKAHDMFVVIVNLISKNWQPKHVTIILFEPFDTTSAAMTLQLR
jgi:hypothetical protein